MEGWVGGATEQVFAKECRWATPEFRQVDGKGTGGEGGDGDNGGEKAGEGVV